MALQERVDIPRKEIERFGKLPLPNGFEALYLYQTQEKKGGHISYDICVCMNSEDVVIGEISVLNRLQEYLAQAPDKKITRINKRMWERHIYMKENALRIGQYGKYGMTKAVVSSFLKEIHKQGIKEVITTILDDNVPSVKLFDSVSGDSKRMRQVWVGDGDKGKIIGQMSRFIYVTLVEDEITQMNQKWPVKKADVKSLVLARQGRE